MVAATDVTVVPLSTLPPGLPDLTLGWGVIEWIDTCIRQPDGPEAGGPFILTDEQLRFILWWYAIDERGRWLYDRGVLRRSKGWGKSPFVAALALAELLGPVRFDRFADDGTPVGRPVGNPLVQIAAVSQEQGENTYTMVTGMLRESPAVEAYGLDVGLTRVLVAGGGKLTTITSSSKTAEGGRPTAVFGDETQHWLTSNSGDKLSATLRRNLGKSRDGAARFLETTNAHAPGEESVAEKSHEAWEAGQQGRTKERSRILYDSLEAVRSDGKPIDLGDDDQLRRTLEICYGDSVWVDLERIRDEVLDPGTAPNDARRFYCNELAAGTSSWLQPFEWSALARPEIVVADGEMITLGFDGSRERKQLGVKPDATALIGCRVSDGHLFPVGIWEAPDGPGGDGWEAPVVEIDATVADAFETWTVVGFFADPAKWESYVDSWEAKYGGRLKVKSSQRHPIRWWMTGSRNVQTVAALKAFRSAVETGAITHDGSSRLTAHALAAVARATQWGDAVHKESPSSDRKIDAVVAAVLAYTARREAVAANLVAEAEQAGQGSRLMRK